MRRRKTTWRMVANLDTVVAERLEMMQGARWLTSRGRCMRWNLIPWWPESLRRLPARFRCDSMKRWRLGFLFWRWKEMMTWQALIGWFSEWRIMTRVIMWLDKLISGGLPHGMIWLSGV